MVSLSATASESPLTTLESALAESPERMLVASVAAGWRAELREPPARLALPTD
jgi:hypothetical protein